MYCPKCSAQNIDDAQYCRGCGENISLVAEAMSGRLPETRAVGYDVEGKPYDESGRRIRQNKDAPRLDKAIRSGFGGMAFLIIAIILGFSSSRRYDWWYWLLIPAFTMIGGGIAEYVRFKHANRTREEKFPARPSKAVPAAARVSALPPLNTAELVPPPSVTENTTRHLDLTKEAPTRHIEKSLENPGKEV